MNNSAFRTLEILEFIANSKKSLGISEISRELQIPKSSVFDIIYVLLEKGYVDVDHQELKTFKLGLRAFQIGSAYINNTGLYHIAHQILDHLKNITGETGYLAVEDKGHIVYLDKVESESPIRSTCNIGSTNLMHLTGLGKAMLAGYPEERVLEITGGGALVVRTPNTISSYEALLESLKKIRTDGYSYDNGEDNELVCCIAAPIRDRYDKVIAAISISMLRTKMTDENRRNLSKLVKEAALDLSYKLGFLGKDLYL